MASFNWPPLTNAGEYIESVISSAQNFAATTQYSDLTSISLTAGDWDVSALVQATANGATVPNFSIGISATSGNSATGLVSGSNLLQFAGPTVNYNSGGSVPSFRVSVSSTTTYYLKIRATFSAATPQAVGRLSARRVR